LGFPIASTTVGTTPAPIEPCPEGEKTASISPLPASIVNIYPTNSDEASVSQHGCNSQATSRIVNKTNISHNNLQAASAVVKILHSAHVKLNIPLMLHQSLTRVQVDPHLHHGTTKIPSIEERILDPEHHQ